MRIIYILNFLNMKKTIFILALITLLGFITTGCTNNKESIDKKPNTIKATISWIWWSLSREISIIWDEIYYNSDIWEEIIPINPNTVENYVRTHFNSAWDLLIASCNEWYIMKECDSFSNTDDVTQQIKDNQCILLNEDPNLMRTSMIVECLKI